MTPQPTTDYERAVALQEAQRQEAAAGHQRLYELAEKMTGMSTAERVASAARKRATPSCPTKQD